MDNRNNSTRLERMSTELADTVESSVTEASKEIISALISDAKTWIMNAYENWKTSRSIKPKYKELKKYIEASNESIQIGMDKKEIAVMWAMRNLGYTQEETEKVLDLANKAYLNKKEIKHEELC